MARLSEIIRERDESYLTLNLLESENNLSDVANSAVSLSNLGVTASTAELNVLDGVTTTTTQLNYANGVSSDIQTQLDAKMTPTYTGDVDITGELIVDSYNETFVSLTPSANVDIDCESGNIFTLSLNENTTLTFSNPPSANTAYGFTLKVVQDSTSRAITWPASVDWPDATAPTLSTGSGDVDVFVFFTTDGGTTWYGFQAGAALA